MQIPIPLITVAPQATDHPLALPRTPQTPPPSVRVTPPRASTDTSFLPQPPDGFWRRMNGDPDPENHLAPPSIMQIKIEQMLEDMRETPPTESTEAQQGAQPEYSGNRQEVAAPTTDARV